MVQPKKVAGGAFGQFLNEKRPELQAQCKGQPITAITKLASEKFKALSAEDKAIYEKKYEAAKAKYDEDMKVFLEAGGQKKAIQRKGKKGDKKLKKKKDPQAPKKPAGGAYGCFLAKNRDAFQKQCKGMPMTAELSDDDKKIFEEEYQKKKEEYQEAMKSYVPLSNEGESEEPPTKKRKTKEEKEEAKQSKAAEKAAEKEAAKAAKAAKAQAKAEAKAAKGKAEAKPKAAAKAKAKNAPKSPGVKMDSAVVAKAEKLGYKDTLLKLAAHHEVIASGKSQSEMLQALEQKGGLLHPARRALLGA
eukprot:Skav211310  [mRNA]  locus=scaffold3605:51823:52984:+ [translate_table: standard]